MHDRLCVYVCVGTDVANVEQRAQGQVFRMYVEPKVAVGCPLPPPPPLLCVCLMCIWHCDIPVAVCMATGAPRVPE